MADFWLSRELTADEWQLKEIAMQVSSLAEMFQKIECYLGRNVSKPRESDLSTERNTDDETALK
jgi:hypothetical protein